MEQLFPNSSTPVLHPVVSRLMKKHEKDKKRPRGRPRKNPAEPPKRQKMRGRGRRLLKDALSTSKLDPGEHYMNIRLTAEEQRALREVAEARRAKLKELIYPLVLQYLLANADPGDRPVVTSPKATLKDKYWGSIEEIQYARRPPRGLVGSPHDRPKFSQQIVTAEQLEHLRGLERYYRVSIHELAASAIVWGVRKIK